MTHEIHKTSKRPQVRVEMVRYVRVTDENGYKFVKFKSLGTELFECDIYGHPPKYYRKPLFKTLNSASINNIEFEEPVTVETFMYDIEQNRYISNKRLIAKYEFEVTT